MKLLYSILSRITLITTAVLTGWAVCFYFIMMDEINDEVDDSLEDYAELIVMRTLAGEKLPAKDNGTNNQYYLHEVSPQYAAGRPTVRYADQMVYIREKKEKEPARTLTYIFTDNEGRFYELTVSVPHIEKADLKETILLWATILYSVLLLFLISLTAWMVSRYTRKMEYAAEQQKQFIGNASHEIQTPLAICRNRLEMLMEDGKLEEPQLVELAKALQTIDRISRLNKSLLLLSKIDSGLFQEEQLTDINVLLKHYLEDYAEVYAHRHITLGLHEEGTFLTVINESLATALLTNLLKNAYVHNVENGQIEIYLQQDCMIFKNNAADGTPLDGKRIFERFYHNRQQEGSTGLGLSIVQAICQQCGLTVKYYFEPDMHCFEVKKQKK